MAMGKRQREQLKAIHRANADPSRPAITDSEISAFMKRTTITLAEIARNWGEKVRADIRKQLATLNRNKPK